MASAVSPVGRILEFFVNGISALDGFSGGFNFSTLDGMEHVSQGQNTCRIFAERDSLTVPGHGDQNIYSYKLEFMIGITVPWAEALIESERQVMVLDHQIRQFFIDNRQPTITGITSIDFKHESVRFGSIVFEFEDRVVMVDGAEIIATAHYAEVISPS